ncbi:MAG: hypothetical protein NTW03_08585 [Verrucomicrobia bacterium]|nr:hypothetical protein [Verrucomicrobiota bacterium]
MVRDNGGTANGGVNAVTNTFNVTVTLHAQKAILYTNRDFGVVTVNSTSTLAPLGVTSTDTSTLAITNRVFCVRLAGISPTNLLIIEASSNRWTGSQCSPTRCLAILSSTPTWRAANTPGASTGPSSFHLRPRAWSPSLPAPS